MKFGERQCLSYWGVSSDLHVSDSCFERWHFCDKQQRNSLCLGIVPKYPRRASEPTPSTGRGACALLITAAWEVSSGDSTPSQCILLAVHREITVLNPNEGISLRCKLPSHCWCQCRPQVWYLSDGGSTAEGTGNSLKSSTPHARWEWDKELTFTLMCMFKRHSWGLFCCLYNLILKRFLCVTKSDLHVCWRGYYIPWYY